MRHTATYVLTTPMVISVIAACAIRAQSLQLAPAAPPQFVVASIKPTSGPGVPFDALELGLQRSIARASRGGRLLVPSAPLHLLIQLAYNARGDQIVGEPPWGYSDAYEVNAKTDSSATFEQMRPMLQALLADRFKLSLHKETRASAIYELVVAKGGPRITPAKEGSCITSTAGDPLPPFGSKICGGIRVGIGRMEGFAVEMSKLVERLSDQVGRNINDKTGLSGRFDFVLNFRPEEIDSGPGPATIGDVGRAATSANLPGPSILTALQEQLGLRLQSLKGPGEVLVIDHVEKPGEN